MGVLGKILVKLGLDSSEFQKGTKSAQNDLDSFVRRIKDFSVKMAGGVFALAALKKAFSFNKEAYNTAAQAEGVERAFARLNNPNLLNDLRVATQGTVSDLELMQNAIQAKNFKIPLENLATYLKFANTRAKETGQSVDYLVQSIVLGVGRKSPLILDNLGISALEVREEFAKTGDMAKAVANIIDREMGSANNTIAGSKELIGQSSSAWKNAMVVLGKFTIIKSVGDWFNKASAATANFLSSLVGTTKELGANEQAVRAEGKEINMLISQLTNFNTKEGERKIILDKLREIQPKIVEGLNAENIATGQLIETAKEYNRELVARIALAARQDTVAAAVNRQLEAGTNVMNKEAEIAKFLLNLQSDLATADIEKSFLDQTQGITRCRKITNEERAKIISDYSEIVSGTGEWSDKMAAAYKLLASNSMSVENIKGINLKPFFAFTNDIGKLTRELDDAGEQAEKAKQEVEDFKKTFSQLFETATPEQTEEKVTQFKELITQIQKTEVKIANLQTQAQKSGYTDKLTEDIKQANNDLAPLLEQYKTLTGKEWGAKIKIETDKDQLKNAAEGTIAFLENELSKLEVNFKLAGTDKARTEIQDKINTKKVEIEAMLVVKPKTERQAIEDAIKGYEDMQLAIPIGVGSPEELAAAQAEWDRLSGLIKQAREELEKYPKAPEITLPEGSVADFNKQIADIDKNIDNLTGSELAAAQAARAMLEFKKEGATSGWQTQLEKEVAYLDVLKKALEEAGEAQKKYAQEAVDAQQKVVDGFDAQKTAIKQFNDDVSSAIENGATAAIVGLGAAIGELVMGNTDAVWGLLLNPIADMAIQLGEIAIAAGIGLKAIKDAFENMNPYVAIAAGIALVALGTAIKGAISNMSGQGSTSNASNPNTFSGGYSNGGSSTRTASSLQLASPQPQVVVLETRVSGSDIVFAADKETQRRKR